jgi:hypothetical protein
MLPVFPEAAGRHREVLTAREQGMSGVRGEPVDVWLRHGRPARFVWRGRMYTVLLVLDHLLPAADPPGGRECWRVEATPLRAVPAVVYLLCRDPVTDRWSLSRA